MGVGFQTFPFVFVDVSRFVYQLCWRCYRLEIIPLENTWYLLLSFKTSEGASMPEHEFLIRLKRVNKVKAAIFRHFDLLRNSNLLFSAFLLRSWVISSNESNCQDEYLKNNYAPITPISIWPVSNRVPEGARVFAICFIFLSFAVCV